MIPDDGLLARGRAMAEAGMTLTLAAFAPAPPSKDADGFDVLQHTPKGLVHGKVQGGSQAGKDTKTRYVSIGEVERPVIEGGVQIPISVPVPVASEHRGTAWEYEVVAVGPADDPALLGRRYLVVEAPAKSKATARRLNVIEL